MSVVANVAINVDSRGATQKLREVQNQANATEKAVGGLGGAVGKLASGFAVLEAAKFIFAKTAEIESQARSLEVLTGSAQKAGLIIKELQDLGAVTPFTSTELIDAAKRLQAFGVESEKVVETTKRLADVSGATGAELQGLVTAYGQVQAKGRLQGEELLQFQERGVALQEELRKLYKLSGDEFQDALEKGRISAAAVEVAINRLTSVGGKYANGAIAQSDTLSGKLSTLQDGIDQLARVLGQTLSPVLKQLLEDVTNFVNGFAQGLQVIQSNYNTFLANLRGKTSNELQGQIGQLDSFIASNQKQLAKIRPGSQTEKQIQAKIVELRNLRSSLQKDLDKKLGLVAPVGSTTLLPTATGAGGAVPPLLDGSGGSGRKKGKTDAEREAERAAEQERRLQERLRGLQIESQLTQKLLSNKLLIADVENLGNKEVAIGLKAESQTLEIVSGLQKSLIGVTDQRERLALITKTAAELDSLNVETLIELERNRLAVIKEQNAEFFKRAGLNVQDNLRGGAGDFDLGLPDLRVSEGESKINDLKQQLKELADPINVALNGATAIGDAFSTAFTDVITGAKSAQQALSEVFKKIADAFIEAATQIIAKQIALITFQTILNALGGGGGFSFGGAGPVSGASVFGSGQAAFNPAAFSGGSFFAEGGFVTGPTNAVIGEGGQPEYVIPASKMSAAMSRYAAGSRGASVIPGGDEKGGATALATAPMEPIDVRYSVDRINNVDYVTTDQFQRGLAQAAQQGAIQGERRALRTLGNSPANRRRIGL